MIPAALAISVLAVIVAAHSVIFAAMTGWLTKQATLWRTDPDQARARCVAPPWFVRYGARLL